MKKDSQRSTGRVGYWHSQYRSENTLSASDQSDLKPTQMHENFPPEAKIAAMEEVTSSQAEGDAFIAQSLENMCFWEEKYRPRKQQYSDQERQQQRLGGCRSLGSWVNS